MMTNIKYFLYIFSYRTHSFLALFFFLMRLGFLLLVGLVVCLTAVVTVTAVEVSSLQEVIPFGQQQEDSSEETYTKVPLDLPKSDIPSAPSTNDRRSIPDDDDNDSGREDDFWECFKVNRSKFDVDDSTDAKISKLDICMSAVDDDSSTSCKILWVSHWSRSKMSKHLMVGKKLDTLGINADFCISHLVDEANLLRSQKPFHPWMVLPEPVRAWMFSPSMKAAMSNQSDPFELKFKLQSTFKWQSDKENAERELDDKTHHAVFWITDLLPVASITVKSPFAIVSPSEKLDIPVSSSSSFSRKPEQTLESNGLDEHENEDDSFTVVTEDYPTWLFIVTSVILLLIAGALIVYLFSYSSVVVPLHNNIRY